MPESKAMTLRLPAELAEELELVCTVDDEPVAEAVRVAIADYIRSRRENPHFQLCLRDHIARMQALMKPKTAADAEEG